MKHRDIPMKNKSAATLTAGPFYDSISDFYGRMIDFGKNLQLRINAYQRIFPVKGAAADVGCGIGLDALALAKNGHRVTAFDISPNMIEQTRKNAEKYGLSIKALVYSYEKVPKKFNHAFNYVISMGNAIAHLNPDQLKRAVKRMHEMLAPGGKLFLHILNYSLITKQSRIKNIAGREGNIIIRFYDINGRDLRFNILSFSVDSPKDFQLVTTEHYPHTKGEIYALLKSAGFEKIRSAKNFNGDKFSSLQSRDLFIEAVKRS